MEKILYHLISRVLRRVSIFLIGLSNLRLFPQSL